MGYYSNVGLALTRTGIGTLRENKTSLEQFLNQAAKHLIDEESGAEAWYWSVVKWYIDDPEYHPEVSLMEEFLHGLDEKDYCFLRIGEDIDDIEERGAYFDNPFEMYIARKIVFKQ